MRPSSPERWIVLKWSVWRRPNSAIDYRPGLAVHWLGLHRRARHHDDFPLVLGHSRQNMDRQFVGMWVVDSRRGIPPRALVGPLPPPPPPLARRSQNNDLHFPSLSSYRLEDRYLEFVSSEDQLTDLRKRFESYVGPFAAVSR